MLKEKLYVVYKITNKLDKRIYIGVHLTHNVEDRYMGSGVEIRKDLKTLGKKCFSKEVLFIFDNKEEMLLKEKELVTKEFCMRTDTYNRIEGGGSYSSEGMVSVKDKKNNYLLIYKTDSRYLSGEFVPVNKGMTHVKDDKGNIFYVSTNDERYKSGELVSINKGVKHSEEHCKNKNIRIKKFYENHPGTFKGKFHSKDSKQKMKKVREERGLNLPEKNSQFGTFWITNGIENKKTKSEIPKDWYKGRIKQ
ncbi:MAG: hypothetical protein ABIP51_08330 [Bacteroidia bacterium]